MVKKFHQRIVFTQTPFRISFFGGGTDFPAYFNKHGGSVIGTAIDKYLYVTVNSLERFFDKRIRLSYSKLESVDSHKDLEHNIVRCILENHPYWEEKTFLDIHTFADFPSSCGLGSSSTFCVGMLNALYLLSNKIHKTPEEIAKEAIHVERVQLKEAGGWQDQLFAAYGGFNHIKFLNNTFTVEPICLSLEKRKALEESCLMFFTGNTRSSSKIQQQVMKNSNFDYFKEIQAISKEAFALLNHTKSRSKLVKEFGTLLDNAWQAKKALSNFVSTEKIDQMYKTALNAGAFGGKLCGAGEAGFLLLIVPKEEQKNVIKVLDGYKSFNISFEDSGSRAIYLK